MNYYKLEKEFKNINTVIDIDLQLKYNKNEFNNIALQRLKFKNTRVCNFGMFNRIFEKS